MTSNDEVKSEIGEILTFSCFWCVFVVFLMCFLCVFYVFLVRVSVDLGLSGLIWAYLGLVGAYLGSHFPFTKSFRGSVSL